MLKIETMTVSPTFRDWLASDEATQQLAEAKAENEATEDVGLCLGCEIPLTDDVEQGDSDWTGGVDLCKECWFEWTGESKG